jgi:hypothetical protein
MIKFFLYKIIPTAALLLFMLIMNSGDYLKGLIGSGNNVSGYFSDLKKDIASNQWTKAAADLERMESNWRRVVKWIQFSEERDQIDNFQHTAARLQGYILARDQAGAYAELEELKETWDDLGR